MRAARGGALTGALSCGVVHVLAAQGSARAGTPLPLASVPAAHNGACRTGVVLLTGDGDWAALVRDLASGLAARGMPVEALKMRSYLAQRRTPSELSEDVARMAMQLLTERKCARLAVVGYSRGADVAPFAVSRWPEALKARVQLVALLGLAPAVGFEFHWRDLVADVRRPGDLPTVPEVQALRGIPVLCVQGTEEPASACPDIPAGVATVRLMPGDHHFRADTATLLRHITALLPP